MKHIKVPKGTELVFVGDIHEQEKQFDELIEKAEIGTKRILVSVGDIYDRGEGRHVAESIINKIKDLSDKGYAFMVRGNHEQKYLNRVEIPGSGVTWTGALKYCARLPLSITFVFKNNIKVTALHGGVTPNYTWDDLRSNSELMYVRNIDKEGQLTPTRKIKTSYGYEWIHQEGSVSWHEVYDGRFGYIVAGHEPMESGKVKYYKHSCNVDTKCFSTGVLSGQIICDGRLKEIIMVER